MIEGLRWVRDSIAAFGGDPQQVTVMGQSAGATLVAGLLATPLAAGLFRRAISQSGNGLGAFTPGQARRVTEGLADACAVAPTAQGFAGVPDHVLVDRLGALRGLDLDLPGAPDPLMGLSPCCLVLDPATVPVQPAEAVAGGSAAGVELLIGTNSDEARLYLVPTGRMGEQDAEAMADRLFHRGTGALARAHTQVGGRTFRYEFAWASDAYDGRLGAAHCMELPFVFATTHLGALHGDRSLLGTAAGVAPVVDAVHSAWVDFVRNGEPGWRPATVAEPRVEVIGARPRRLGITPAGRADPGLPLSPAQRSAPRAAAGRSPPRRPRNAAER